MYINERDEINYHGFLFAQRMLVGATMTEVGTGLCTESEIHRAELGKRQPEKLLRDRIAARLGVSGEEYEDYLHVDEYKEWQLRQYILKSLDKGDLEQAERGINDLSTYKRRNKVQKQFVETMRYILRQMQGAPTDELKAILKKAISYTVPNINKALDGAHLLADQELNLILEYIDLQGGDMAQYERVIACVDNSYMDDIAKSKIYPRIACKVSKLVLENDLAETNVARAIELCESAIEYLRLSNRMFYFIEVLEAHIKLLMRIKLHGYKESVERDNKWVGIFKDLFEEYNVLAYMPSFCYLYWESECHSIVEVLEVRRGMSGLSRVKLADNICTDKTIIRYERYGRSPKLSVVRDLFERMGLCAEYKRARVMTSDWETLDLSNTVVNNMNNYEYEAWEKNLEELKNRLNMEISFNKQEVLNNELVLKLSRDGLSDDEFYAGIMEALESTISFESIERKPVKYLTRSELTSMYNLAFESKGEKSEYCRTYIKKLCFNILNKEIRAGRVPVYELLIDGLADYLGDVGEFNDSILLCEKMISESLKKRRMFSLVNFAYHNLWNQQSVADKQEEIFDPQIAIKILKECIVLSEINYRANLLEFFKDKLNEYHN